jgi:Protein of unknown function (DUF3089)
MSQMNKIGLKKLWLLGGGFFVFLAFIVFALQDDINKYALNPKIPFQIYEAPLAPDYIKLDSWHLNPALNGFYSDPRKVDVFFIHATSFSGGKAWLGSVGRHSLNQEVAEIQLPNYAAPFAVMGNIYAPKYRQASLYSQFSLHEDAREARQFPYRDIELAFESFLKNRRGGRGFVIVGLEQGALMGERLLLQYINIKPELKSQLVAAYLIELAVPKSAFTRALSFGPCLSRKETGCIVAYLSLETGRLDKALSLVARSVTWDGPILKQMGGEAPLCVNPITGNMSVSLAQAKQSQGAANATGLEWPTQPALMARKVSARCFNGLLIVTKPQSVSFAPPLDWDAKKKVKPYNLFYGDIQLDFKERWQSFRYGSEN